MTPDSLYRVYVIQSPLGRYYVGLSEDIQKRLQDHNTGVSKWTRDKGPWKVVWASEAMSLSDARKLENLLKRQKGGADFLHHDRIDKIVRLIIPHARDRRFKSCPRNQLPLKPLLIILILLVFSYFFVFCQPFPKSLEQGERSENG